MKSTWSPERMNEEEEYEEGEEEGPRETKRYQETLEAYTRPSRDTVLLGSRRDSHLFINIVTFFHGGFCQMCQRWRKFSHPDMYSSKQTSYIF